MNLLSWRIEKNKYERKMMRRVIAVAVVSALAVMMIIHVMLSRQIQHDARMLQRLGMSFSAQKNLARTNQILSLDGMAEGFAAGKMVRLLLDEAAKSTASGVCYQQLSRDENGWHLSGQALSVAAFTSARRTLAAANYFKNSVVHELKKDVAQDYFQFILQVPVVQSEHEE